VLLQSPFHRRFVQSKMVQQQWCSKNESSLSRAPYGCVNREQQQSQNR
jgi:hypothetical protein